MTTSYAYKVWLATQAIGELFFIIWFLITSTHKSGGEVFFFAGVMFAIGLVVAVPALAVFYFIGIIITRIKASKVIIKTLLFILSFISINVTFYCMYGGGVFDRYGLKSIDLPHFYSLGALISCYLIPLPFALAAEE